MKNDLTLKQELERRARAMELARSSGLYKQLLDAIFLACALGTETVIRDFRVRMTSLDGEPAVTVEQYGPEGVHSSIVGAAAWVLLALERMICKR